MNAVTTRQLTTKRGVRLILNNINLNIQKGQHTILFGLNGCGKTTLLATIGGYMGYSSGEISLFGKPLTFENSIAMRKDIGFVSNSYFNRVFQHENALSIVISAVFGEFGERWEITPAHIHRAKALLSRLGLREKSEYPYDMLSYGQQQRVLIARALMVPPKLLLLDEPCSGLDVLSRQYLLNTIRSIAEESDATIICATHYGEEILGLYKKAVFIKNGKVFADGPIGDVFNTATLSAFFNMSTACSWQDGHINFEIAEQYSIPSSIWR